MSTDDAKDKVGKIVQEAVDQIAGHDPALRGSVPTRWILIAEHQWSEGGSTLSAVQSDDLTPWDSLGMLRFITAATERGTFTPPEQ